MSRKFDLRTLRVEKNSWLYTRQEQDLFSDLIMAWRVENPKPTLIQEMLIEDLVRLHIWTQRLTDRSVSFFGHSLNFRKPHPKAREKVLDEEDTRLKSDEWEKYFPLIIKWKTDLMKLAMANNINVDLTGDISSLFAALDKSKTAETECDALS